MTPVPNLELFGRFILKSKKIYNFRLDKMLKWSTDYFMAAHKSGGLKFFLKSLL